MCVDTPSHVAESGNTGSRARGDLLPKQALHHFSAGGAPTLRKLRLFLPCPLPIPSPCFPSVSPSSSYVMRSVIAAAAASFVALCMTAQSSRARLDRWARRPRGKDLISLSKRRQILRVHMRGCTSLFVSVNNQVQSRCCDFQASQGSQVDLINAFLKHVTQTSELVSSPLLLMSLCLRKRSSHCRGLPPNFSMALQVCKHAGAPSMRGRSSNRTSHSQ